MFPFSIRFVMFTSFFSLGLLGCDRIALCDDSQSDTVVASPDTLVAKAATEAMKKATAFMTSQVAVHGGYVYDAWLKRSRLPDGQIARFYELETNRPLYFTKDDYLLTYDDSNLPTHYSFKSRSNVQKLEVRYQILIRGDRPKVNKSNLRSLRKDVDRILGELDSGGRWVTDKNGAPAIHSNRPDLSVFFLESNVFSKNLSRLAEFVTAAKNSDKVP